MDASTRSARRSSPRSRAPLATQPPAGRTIAGIRSSHETLARRVGLVVVVAMVTIACRPTAAATLTWDNGGGDKLWSTATNWNPDGAPSGNDIVFTATGTAALGTVTNTVDGSVTVNSLNYQYSGTAQTTQILSGQTLTVSGTGVAFNAGITGTTFTQASSTVITGPGALAVTGGTTASFTVASGSAGSQVITRLDMSGLSSFTANVGSFTMATKERNAASVLLSASNSITALTLTLGGNSTATSTNNDSFLGLGATNVINANTINVGTIRAGGTMAFQSTVSNGTLTIRDRAGTGAANLVAGSLNNSASITPSGILDFSTGTVDARLGTATLGQGASGSGVGGGIGTITMGAGSIVSGTINAGTAGSTTNGAGTAIGTVNLLANSGTLSATSVVLGRQTNAQPSNSAGVINQNGGAANLNSITFANYTAAGTGLVSGTYNLAGGILRSATIQAGANSSSTGTSSRTFNWTGGTIQNLDALTNLTIAGSNSFALTLGGSGSRSFTADSGRTITVSAAIGGTGGFSKDGTGTLVLTASNGNSYSGVTAINAGILTINSQWQLGGANYQGLSFNGGTLQYASVLLNGTTDPTTLGRPVTIDAGGGTIDTNGNTITVANAFGNGGTGAFTKAGAGLLALNGAGTYTGATTVASGTLLVNGALASSGVTVNSLAVLGGTGTFANGATINGTLSPGNTLGLITLGSLTLNASSTTLIEVTSAGTRGIDYDAIDVTGAGGLTYGGTMSLAFGGSALPDNTVLTVFGFTGTPSSSFAGISSTGYYAGTWSSLGGGDWQIASGSQTATFSQSAGTITIVPEPTSCVALVAGIGLGILVLRRRQTVRE